MTAWGTDRHVVVRKTVIVALVSLALLGMLAAVTVVALEGGDVAVLRTFAGTEPPHEARVWVVDLEGGPWIEVADTDRAYYARLLANPHVELVRGGEVRSYRAVPLTSPRDHERIRELLARKYGWADRWVGLLVDTSESIAVQLVPAGARGDEPDEPAEGSP